MDIPKAESEKSIRGSREAFTEDLETNIQLITKRITDVHLQKQELVSGRRTRTRIVLFYIKGVADERIAKRVRDSIEKIDRDEVMDVGVVEQLIRETVWTPFPLCQATERPDRTCQGLLEGRVAVLAEHSPDALLYPVTMHSLFQTSDDYYRNFFIVSFLRMIRYLAAILAVFLPAFYVAAASFHTQILPTKLVLMMAKAREGVPFPCWLEVLLMELAFELIREAGLRMPGAIGNTIGIVGGLIVGQAAVSANLVSPMTVVVVAVTALGSFSVTNEEFSEALRLTKYGFLLLGATVGLFGISLAWYLLILHLSELTSLGIPFLYPFVGAEVNQDADLADGIFRAPLRWMKKRPVYANKKNRHRM